MSVSLKFKFMQKYVFQLFSEIVQNQNIAKYIYYKVNDPLSMPNVTIDMQSEGYYHLNFFDETITKDEKIRLFLNILGSPLKEPSDIVTFLVEVVVPPQYHVLHGRGEYRGICVLNQIAVMVDQQIGIGVGEVKMTNYRETRETRSGYNVTSANIIVRNPTTKGN